MELVDQSTGPALARLGPQHLTGLPAQVRRPSYERNSLHQGIVHLGIGAFARAHLAAINEDTIEATGEGRFGIVGVSLRSRETSEALVPQAGLYALALNDADAQGRPRQSLRVIGNLISLCVAANDAAIVARLIAAKPPESSASP